MIVRCLDENPNLTWTFFLAHPDDELAIAGWIYHLVSIGCRVWTCWAHTTPLRGAESLAALDLIGLPAERCLMGDIPDGCFVDRLHELDSWVQDVIEETAADRYVSVAYEQGHLDHDALHFAVHRWTGHRHLEFPLYWHYARKLQRIGEFADSRGEEVWALDDASLSLKRAMLRCYESQNVARNVAGYELIARLSGKRATIAELERLRHVVKPDYTKPIHEGAAATKILNSPQWARWEGAMAQWVASGSDPDWT